MFVLGHPTIVDGHRVCLYCDMLERATWPHPWAPDPWLCHECVGRCRHDIEFANHVRGQISYSASELPSIASYEVVESALAYYTVVWNHTQAGIEARGAREADDVPF
ncbi:MAG TPA: hypothetical protein VGW38_06050 [Chloroflexota bacterium]|nr:hypothetical protein [Chloroflexota bacterium]